MNHNDLNCLGFSHFLGIGPIRFKALIEIFKDVGKAYFAPKEELTKILGIKLTDRFVQFRNQFDLEKKWQELQKKQITIVTQIDYRYPQQLKAISDPPICLYIKGNIEQLSFNSSPERFFFAIVGTRKPTSYGQQITNRFSRQLSEAGMVIVSGMAIGVDAIAHRAALAAGGKTVAVLGCGVDIIYPAINSGLYYQIIKKGGLIISEFPPGRTVLKGLFIARNRIISGLSKGVLIVEGAQDSGALITARYAAEQGREVFAPPSPITSEMSAAPNLLLKQGAKFVTSVEDIFEEFNLKITPQKEKDITKELTKEEKIIFDNLSNGSKTVDELISDLKKPVSEILNTISILEIKGIVDKDNLGKFQLKN